MYMHKPMCPQNKCIMLGDRLNFLWLGGCLVAQPCPTLCNPLDPMDPRGPPASSIHGISPASSVHRISQERILEYCHFLIQDKINDWNRFRISFFLNINAILFPPFTCSQCLLILKKVMFVNALHYVSENEIRSVLSDSLRPMDCIVHVILQARILAWVAFPFSRRSSQPRDQTQVFHIAGRFFTSWATREAQEYWSGYPISSPVDLPDPGIKPGSPALQANSLPAELPGSPSLCKALSKCSSSSSLCLIIIPLIAYFAYVVSHSTLFLTLLIGKRNILAKVKREKFFSPWKEEKTTAFTWLSYENLDLFVFGESEYNPRTLSSNQHPVMINS